MYKCKSKSGGIKRVVDDSVVIGKVLSLLALLALLALLVQEVRFTGTPVQILTRGGRTLGSVVVSNVLALLAFIVHLVQILAPEKLRGRRQAYVSLLALLVQKYRY